MVPSCRASKELSNEVLLAVIALKLDELIHFAYPAPVVMMNEFNASIDLSERFIKMWSIMCKSPEKAVLTCTGSLVVSYLDQIVLFKPFDGLHLASILCLTRFVYVNTFSTCRWVFSHGNRPLSVVRDHA